MYFGNITSQVILFFTNVFPLVASFSDFSLSDNNSLIACARSDGFSAGTIIPVSLFLSIQEFHQH